MILFIQHVDIEGPETLGKYFEKRGFSIRIISLYSGDKLPKDVSNIDAVISLGGPMNVYEEDKHFFLKDENVFIQKILREQIPFMGICLGAQLLAKACGAQVVKSPQKEIGFDRVRLNTQGRKDPLFQGLDKILEVYQWHEDMVEIPRQGILLAEGDKCPHQAFRMGANAYGLQFHFEITDNSIREWSDEYFKDKQTLKAEKEKMMRRYRLIQNSFQAISEQICANFLKIISLKKASL